MKLEMSVMTSQSIENLEYLEPRLFVWGTARQLGGSIPLTALARNAKHGSA